MKEILQIIQSYDKARAERRDTVLATVVHLDGSSYRRPGARMLIDDEGQITGAISGGCLEGDALQKAQMVMAQKKSRIVTYDTTDESDDTLGVGLGCNGIIRILIEPIRHDDPYNQVEFLKKAAERRQNAVMVTLFSLENQKGPQPGTCLLLDQSGEFHGQMENKELEKIVKEDALDVLRNGRSDFKNYITASENLTAFIEYIRPPVSLVIIGAGNDVKPLVEMADTLGWEARVFDGRASHARPDRFERACQVIVSKPEHVLEQLIIDDQTVFTLMTHNYNYDMAMMKALLKKKVRYIGMLGPKKKLDRMLDEIRAEGMEITEEMMASIYGPVGLDIDAETPEEIALSVLAEIKAVLSGKNGQSLREKGGVIHDRESTMIEERRVH